MLFYSYILPFVKLSNNICFYKVLIFLLYILMCHSPKEILNRIPTHSTKSLVCAIKTFRKVMSTVKEMKTVPALWSSEMIMNGFRNVNLCFINEDHWVWNCQKRQHSFPCSFINLYPKPDTLTLSLFKYCRLCFQHAFLRSPETTLCIQELKFMQLKLIYKQPIRIFLLIICFKHHKQ